MPCQNQFTSMNNRAQQEIFLKQFHKLQNNGSRLMNKKWQNLKGQRKRVKNEY